VNAEELLVLADKVINADEGWKDAETVARALRSLVEALCEIQAIVSSENGPLADNVYAVCSRVMNNHPS
jgi:hypothetical protein